MDYVALATIIFTFFILLMSYVLLETIIVPMCLDMYAWTDEFTIKVSGIGLTITGVVTLFVFILGGKLANIFSDRSVYIILGLIPLTISMLVFLPLGSTYPKIKYCDDLGSKETFELPSNCSSVGCPSSQKWCFTTPIIEIPQFIVACVIVTIGYPICVSLANVIYSKLINPSAQGLWMGILTSAGSFSRVVGPVFVSYLYTSEGPFWTFLTLLIAMILITSLNCSIYKRLQPLGYIQRRQIINDNDEKAATFTEI